MREIKFRGWDGNKMVFSLIIQPCGIDGKAAWLDCELSGSGQHDWKTDNLMQYTGLTGILSRLLVPASSPHVR
jgi:hypothetical protein